MIYKNQFFGDIKIRTLNKFWFDLVINSAFNEIKKIQSLSSNDFCDWQNKRKWEIARFHYNNNKFYKDKIGRKFPDDWHDLPILEKKDYQQALENLLSTGFSRKNTYISSTSGSSGHPFYFAKNKEAHAMTWALVKSRYNFHQIKISSKQARFYGIPLEFKSKSKELLKDLLLNRVRFPVYDLSENTLIKFMEKFKKIKFDYIYGYTNSLVLFAKFLLKNGIILKDICPSLRLCIATSEMVFENDKKTLIEGFGIPLVNEYGVSEVGGITAFEDSKGNWILSPETQFFEVLDDNNNPAKGNDIGNIVITDLHNKAMPFIRYKVGDIGVISDIIINDKYPVLKKLNGRTNDNILLPSGKVAPGLTFYYISRSILESSGVLKEFIIRQVAINSFVFEVVSDRELNNMEIENLKKKMELYLEPGLSLKVNHVQKIIREPSGKTKHFFSELNV